MDGWLLDRARQGHNLGPGSILGAKGKKRGEMAKIGEQSEPSGKPARLGSARFALCLLTLSPPFSPATPLAYTLSLPLPFPAPLPLHGVYVVVQFYPWFKFYFLLFWGMVIYMMIMSLKQKKLKFKPRIKLNHNVSKLLKHLQGIKNSNFVVNPPVTNQNSFLPDICL